MLEWVLIVTMHITSAHGTIRDPSMSTVEGFSSKSGCESASQDIASALIVMVGESRSKQGIAANTPDQSPVVRVRCVRVKK
jgi:hypothetical protein